ncbi:GNAT family N-acetyltransferase [Marinilabiliaceae bacterium ANBcel2]|nr:GNAT family N-acetyltransferase [Marinilabiliaceae bacterium ANBcel2]
MFQWSKIDEDRFGYKTAKWSITEKTSKTNEIINQFKLENGELLIVRVNAKLHSTLFQLQENGLFITDTMITLNLPVSKLNLKENNNSNIDITNATSGNQKIIKEITRMAFKEYKGHYNNNPLLDTNKCNEVYIDWSGKLVENKTMADEVFIAKINNNIIGYASVKVDDKRIAKTGLLAVLPQYQNQGVSKALNQHRLQWCKNEGINEIQVETSLNNVKYINILTGIGFKAKSSIHVLHLNNF